jgi:hypothetical protein
MCVCVYAKGGWVGVVLCFGGRNGQLLRAACSPSPWAVCFFALGFWMDWLLLFGTANSFYLKAILGMLCNALFRLLETFTDYVSEQNLHDTARRHSRWTFVQLLGPR